MTVLEFLQTRQGTLKVIAEATGLSRRSVEMEIQRLRLEGTPILTDEDGARLSRNPEEIRKCAERLRERAITQLGTARALYRAAEKVPMTLFGDAS